MVLGECVCGRVGADVACNAGDEDDHVEVWETVVVVGISDLPAVSVRTPGRGDFLFFSF